MPVEWYFASLPFLCRPLDGAIRLCHQGHKTKLVPSEGEGISLLTLLQIFFDHYCVKFIFQQWNFLAKSFAIWFVWNCRCQRRMYNCEQFGLLANNLVLSYVVHLFKIPPLRSGEPLPKKLRNIKSKSKGTHIRALSRGPAKTPVPHRGLYSNRHLASCRLVFHFFISLFFLSKAFSLVLLVRR